MRPPLGGQQNHVLWAWFFIRQSFIRCAHQSLRSCRSYWVRVLVITELFCQRASAAPLPSQTSLPYGARGYCVDTVGLDAEMIRKYVLYQERQERKRERAPAQQSLF